MAKNPDGLKAGLGSEAGTIRSLEWALGHSIDHSGNLKKRQARFGGFVKRFFELRGAALVYYTRRGDTPRGFIDLSGARVCESRDFAVRPRGYSGGALFIDAAPRAAMLFPKTPADTAAWLSALSSAVSLAQACRCNYLILLFLSRTYSSCTVALHVFEIAIPFALLFSCRQLSA